MTFPRTGIARLGCVLGLVWFAVSAFATITHSHLDGSLIDNLHFGIVALLVAVSAIFGPAFLMRLNAGFFLWLIIMFALIAHTLQVAYALPPLSPHAAPWHHLLSAFLVNVGAALALTLGPMLDGDFR
jgi:hypothetical protein